MSSEKALSRSPTSSLIVATERARFCSYAPDPHGKTVVFTFAEGVLTKSNMSFIKSDTPKPMALLDPSNKMAQSSMNNCAVASALLIEAHFGLMGSVNETNRASRPEAFARWLSTILTGMVSGAAYAKNFWAKHMYFCVPVPVCRLGNPYDWMLDIPVGPEGENQVVFQAIRFVYNEYNSNTCRAMAALYTAHGMARKLGEVRMVTLATCSALLRALSMQFLKEYAEANAPALIKIRNFLTEQSGLDADEIKAAIGRRHAAGLFVASPMDFMDGAKNIDWVKVIMCMDYCFTFSRLSNDEFWQLKSQTKRSSATATTVLSDFAYGKLAAQAL